MQGLQKLDKQLSKLKRQFEEIAHGVTFEHICSLSKIQRIAVQTYPGIYLIEIKTPGPQKKFEHWRAELELQWNNPLLRPRFTPSTKNKRMNAHNRLKTWMPLYIGKSKKIWHRIGEHINLGLDDNTFALKLRLRPWLSLKDLRLSTINFQVLGIENYNIVAPVLERALRDVHNPVVGQ